MSTSTSFGELEFARRFGRADVFACRYRNTELVLPNFRVVRADIDIETLVVRRRVVS